MNVNVIVTAETLLESDGEPGWVAGVGPVTADEARMLATDRGHDLAQAHGRSRLRVLTGVAEHRYRPTAKLDRAVRARERSLAAAAEPASQLEPTSTTPLPGPVMTCSQIWLCCADITTGSSTLPAQQRQRHDDLGHARRAHDHHQRPGSISIDLRIPPTDPSRSSPSRICMSASAVRSCPHHARR